MAKSKPLQLGQVSIGGKRPAGDRWQVDPAVAQDLVPEPLGDGVAHLGGLVELVHDRVGREADRALVPKPPPAAGDGALRATSPRETTASASVRS